MKKFLLSLVSLLMLTLSAQAGAPYKLLTFPATGGADINNYTTEWTATVGEDVWTLNGFNTNKNVWDHVRCGRKNTEHTATITSPAVDKAITHVLVSVLAAKNMESVTLTVLNGEEVVGEPKDITESFVTGEVVTEVAGAAGYSYKLTVNSTAASANGSVQIGKVALYEEGQYVDEATHIANTAETAYTVAEAIALIEAGESLSETVYVKGIVSQVDKFNESYKSIQYWISDDGTTINQFECYSGKGIGGADFASIDDVKVGASVIVKGTMKKYTPKEGDPIYEFNQNNELVNYEAPAEPVYIQNADFASLEGWTAVTSESYKDLGNGLIGTYQVRSEFDAATVDETHLATEYCIGLEARWTSSFASYTQTVTILPAGSYSLVYDVENVNAATTAADYENRFTVTVGETVYTDSFTEWMKGKSAWTTHAIVFTVEEGQQVTISLGYGTGSNNLGVSNTPALFVSHLKLADAATGEALILAKAKAEKLAVLDAFVAGEGLFQYSLQAIELAKRAVNAANTVEEVEAVAMPAQTLPDAEKQYTLQQKASGLYMSLSDGVKLAAKAYPLSWVATEGGWYIKNEDLYVGLAGSDNWTMSTDADKKLVITPAAIDVEGVVYYTLSEVKGMIASDGTEAGSACYTDKSVAKSGDKAYWTIAEYIAPVVYNVTIAEGISNGTVEATPTEAEAGETVSLTAIPAEGYELESFMVTCKTIDEVVVVGEDHVFTMPADDVTVSATFVEAGPAPVVWEAYPGWVRDNVASAYYFGVITPGTASEAFAMSGFQLAQESGAGAAERYAVIATAAPEGTTLSADKVLAVSENPVTPTVANPGKNYDYTFSEDIILKGATTYYVVFTTANEPVDGNYTVGAQRLSLNVSYGEYAPGLVAGNGTAQKNWTPGFKAQLTVPAFAITCAVAENGSIQTDVAEAKAGEKVIVTATPAEGYKLKNIMVTGKTTDIAVEVAEDGSFIMPADEVTVSATFQELASVVYIETDLTSQFSSLTDYSKWVGATGYTATNYCPAVTTNAGQTVQVCEKYVSSCTDTGDIFYQTLSGLAEGTYKIELYGGAAFTFGRGFGSQAFTGETGTGDAWGTHVSDTYTAGQHIDTETGVKLYAVTSEGEFGGEIPIYYATDFPDGAAVVTLNGVKVGSNGEMKIGMSKTSQSTNWHVIQLKGVTATVDAASLLAHSVKEAKAIDPATVPAALATQINETVEANDKEYETAEEYQAAIAAIDAVVAKAAPYAPLTEVLNLGETYKANSSNEDAKSTYDTAIADVKAAYDAVTVEDFAAAIAKVNAALPALARTQTADGSDLTVFIVNPTINGADGWTCERPKGGNGPLLNGTAFEYWAGNADPRSEGCFDYYQVIEGLPNGLYTISAEMYNSLNSEGGDYTEFAATSGVYGAAGGAEVSKLVDVDGTDLIKYTTETITVTDGTLRIGVKNVTTPMAARWFVADNFSLTLVKAISDDMVPYYAALNSIEDGESYRVFTEVGEKKFYLNTAGYLVADAKTAATFTFAKVNASGTLYETGINLGCKFTNPSLTNGSTGDIVKKGHIIVGTNNRNDWERQVFFLKDGKYAVRATNANSENWGANTYWTVDNVEAELPNAEYALTPSYVWQIEANVDNRPEAFEKAQKWAAKLQAIGGLVTDASHWTTNAQESSEGAIKNICDGDINTFFHSQWSGTGPDADHYIEATLPEAAQKFHIAFHKRNDNNRPTSISVSAGDAEPAQTITEGLPATAWYATEVDLGAASDVIRFTVTQTNTGGANNGHVFFTFGEFYILPCNELTDAASKYIVNAYTDLADEDVEAINNINAQIEAAYQQVLLKEELADLAACVEHAKEYVAAYPAADADELVRDATTTLNNLANGEYTTKEEIASAKSMAITAVKLFVSAAGTPTKDTDITEWFIVNPTPTTNGDGWTITNASGAPAAANAYDPVNNNAEFWNQLGYTIAQTVVLPAGEYKLTAVAYTRTAGTANGYTFDDMNAVLKAGDAQMTIALLSPTEVNGRAAGKTKMDEGLCDNELKFVVAETGEIVISLTSDPTQNDAWTVWRSFKIEKLAPAAPESVEYAGIIEQTVVNRQTGQQMGETTTDDQTITLIDAGEGLVDIKVNGGFTLPISMTIPEFTIKGVTVVVSQETGSATYSYAGSVSFPQGQYTVTYEATLTGYQASVEATPVFCVVLTQALIDTIYFGADQNAIDAYKTAVGIKDVKGAQNVGTIYDLSGRKVEKMVKGGIYIVNGKKVSFK